MAKSISKSGWGSGVVVFLVWALTLAGTASADVVYRWTTEGGTLAFTDDAEKIPARYAADAQKDSLESLRSYPRLTIENPVLPAVSAPPVASSVSHGQAQGEPEGLSVLVGGTRFGNNAAVVPVGGDLDSDAPTIIENYRVKPKDSMATRHVTVIKKDGRIISIQRNQLNQDDRSGMVPPVR